MYLISSHKKGVSSHQIARDCEITQKAAWYIMQKIRTLFGQNDSIGLDGDVEIDEMYLGGREINKHECKKTEGTQGRSTKTKTPIFGMVQRNVWDVNNYTSQLNFTKPMYPLPNKNIMFFSNYV